MTELGCLCATLISLGSRSCWEKCPSNKAGHKKKQKNPQKWSVWSLTRNFKIWGWNEPNLLDDWKNINLYSSFLPFYLFYFKNFILFLKNFLFHLLVFCSYQHRYNLLEFIWITNESKICLDEYDIHRSYYKPFTLLYSHHNFWWWSFFQQDNVTLPHCIEGTGNWFQEDLADFHVLHWSRCLPN